jgi:hypothetical protein
VLLSVVTVLALAQDPRDDEIFGAPAPEPAPAPAPVDPRDADLFGTPAPEAPVAPPPEAALAETMKALEDRFTIGGRLWLQTQANIPEGVDDPAEVTLDAPSRLDLYADARPNDRVRAYASGRLTHDFTVRASDVDPLTGEAESPETVLLDQLYLKFDAAHRVFFTVGRQRILWGVGRFWNPTDFLNQQRLDPLAVFDVRTGVDLIKVHVPVESANANFYAIANLEDAQNLEQIGGALRAEVAFGQTELTASGSVRSGEAQKLGATLSSGIGPFDLAIEGALQHGSPDAFYAGQIDLATFTFPRTVDRSDEWLPQVVGRIEASIPYGADDSVILGAEYFRNEQGYENADLLPWLFLNGAYVPLYFGRDYGGGYVLLAGPGRADDHTFIASVIANLSDRSLLARFDWRARVLTWLEPNLFVSWSGGENGELHFSYTLAPQPLIPGLEEGISIPAPFLTVGAGAVARF